MGLDMYAWKVKPEDAIDAVTIRSKDDGRDGDLDELFYWRKHHDLHGWMENLWVIKSGGNPSGQSFNCCPVRLDEDDLFELEQDVRRKQLPETTGFFFGNNPQDAESISRDLEFIAKARTAINEGYVVYYDSWW